MIVTLFASAAFAVDITTSVELDATQGAVRPDVQLSVGQVFADNYRVHVDAERTVASDQFPSSDKNYRVGISDSIGSFTIDTGIGSLNANAYGFVKVTATWDSAAKK